jgi:hypothetical protein
MTHFLNGFQQAPLLYGQLRKDVGRRMLDLVDILERNNLTPHLGGSLEPIVEIQAASETAGGHMKLFQLFDPRHQRNVSPANTIILTVERDGVPVGCCGARLITIRGTLREAMEEATIFYNERSLKPPGWSCRVTAESAARVRDGEIAWTGAIHVTAAEARIERQEGRPGMLVETMLRLLHAHVVSHWRAQWLVGLCREPVMRFYGHTVYGYASADRGVWLADKSYYLMTSSLAYARSLYLSPAIADISRPLGLPSEELRA